MTEPWSKSRFQPRACSRTSPRPTIYFRTCAGVLTRQVRKFAGHPKSPAASESANLRAIPAHAGRPMRTAMRAIRWLSAIVAVTFLLNAPARAAETVDLLLVLAADVSRSVDAPKFQLQREGYAAAISDPRVVDAIRSGPSGNTAICFAEWSGIGAQKVVIDWSIVKDGASARQFGDQLLEIPRSFADRTSISGGIEFAVAQLDRAPFESGRRTIDVSGDGTNNSAPHVTPPP